MATNNLFSWFSGGTKERELKETRASWDRVQTEWRASQLAHTETEKLANDIVTEATRGVERMPAPGILAALCDATAELIRAESIGDIEPIWSVIESNIEAAIDFPG